MTSCEPIFVAGPARCGTTMLTGLLHYHGAWVGEAKVTQNPETNSLFGSENVHIKATLKNWSNPNPQRLRDAVLALVKTDGPWVVKTPQLLVKNRLLIEAFPEALWLLPRRPIEDIVASALRHPGMRGTPERRRQIANNHLLMQGEVRRSANWWMDVDVDALARGDMAVAREAVEFAGLDFKEEVAAAWIKPEMWHGG